RKPAPSAPLPKVIIGKWVRQINRLFRNTRIGHMAAWPPSSPPKSPTGYLTMFQNARCPATYRRGGAWPGRGVGAYVVRFDLRGGRPCFSGAGAWVVKLPTLRCSWSGVQIGRQGG